MKNSNRISKRLIVAAVIAGIGLLAWVMLNTGGAFDTSAQKVKLPEFSAIEVAGRAAFDAKCAVCHGTHGSGTDKGPPLMHTIYNPGHHSDESFRRAVQQGVRQHHWRFGDMAPLPQVTDRELAEIVRYVRALQRANGIVFQQHQM